MHRSGTSALTRVLSLCGGALPAGLIGANANNPFGYWEPRAAIDIDEAILHRHGSGPYDPSLRLLEEGAFDAEETAAWIGKIEKFFETLPATPLVVIKEPRITTLCGMWFEAARRAGFDVAAVIAVRHPQEVVASLAKTKSFSSELANALWLKYNLLAERGSRGLPRVFVDYANLLDDWRREIRRISSALAVDLTFYDEEAIDEFLIQDFRHHRHCGPVANHFGTDWMSTVYAALQAAARDKPMDEAGLQEVFETYRASEHVFRTAFETFRDDFRDNVPPTNGILLHLFRRVALRVEIRSGRLILRVEVRRLGHH